MACAVVVKNTQTLNMKGHKMNEINMKNAKRAVKIQKLIDKLLGKLDKLGYEYMNHNNQSAIRRKR